MSCVARKPVFVDPYNQQTGLFSHIRWSIHASFEPRYEETGFSHMHMHVDSMFPLLPKSKISSLYSASVAVQPGLCRTWSEIPKTGFQTTRLI